MSSEGANASTGEQDALVPKLRFPEFRDAPDWQLSPLKNFAKRRTRKNAGAKIDRVLTNSAEHGIVDQRDYFENDVANPGNLEGYFVVEKGDYVYNPRISNLAPVGPINKNDIGLGVMSPLYTVFSFDGANNDFYAHYFKTPDWHNYLRHVSNSGARHDRMAISADDFINMPVPVSNPLEQQKIADCLSSIDALIAAETGKLDAMKDHKKGLMQQVFPAPDKNTPRLRFPEFQDAGKWEVKPLAQLARNMDNRRVPIARGERVSGIFPYYGASGVVDYVDGYIFDEDLLCISEDGANLIARSTPIAFSVSGKCWINNHAHVLKFDNNYTKMLVEEYINAVSLEDFLTGMAQPKLNKAMLDTIPIPIPKNERERKMVAGCLSTIGIRIATQREKIDVLKAHKQGLMQQLFPVADEVQG